MKVGFFYTPNQTDQHRLALKAMRTGVSKSEDCFIQYDSKHEECDLAVTWGIHKLRLPCTETRKIIHDEQKLQGKRTMVIELGYVNRDRYYSVGYDSQNGWADFRNKDMPPDRWSLLGAELKEYRKNGDHILLCGQVPWDTSVQHVDYNQWCIDTIKTIKNSTNKPIVFRPHPLAHDAVGELPDVTVSNKASLKEDLDNCWAVVALNSNALVEAVIEGVPIFACNDGSMAQGVSNNLVDLDNPRLHDREQWAYNLAYSQWTTREMKKGLTWEHLKET